MDQVNEVRMYFNLNYGAPPLRTEILTFLTLGNQDLPGVSVSLSKDGPALSCKWGTYEWKRSRRPSMNQPSGMRTKIELQLGKIAAAVHETYKDYHTKSLLHLCRTKTYFEHRHDTVPLDYAVQLQLHTEMSNIKYDPDGHTLSDEITDAEYINWAPTCNNLSQTRARYLWVLSSECKIAFRLAKKINSAC